MPFGFDTLNEVSLIAMIDGADCSKEESVMGYWGLLIWITLAIYLMAGQFVICEEYFVPILAQLGDRWNMAEDVQGATLLAVGSSSPELFTALLGVIFYPDDNPGPGTNVGSAVFNLCIIVGLSSIFAPRAAKLQIIPFLRDSIAYMIGLIELYLFYSVITPGIMDIWESVALTAWWVLYVFIVYRTDLLASRCCCCVPQQAIINISDETELDTIPDEENHGTRGNTQNPHKQTAPSPDFDQNPDNIHIAPGCIVDDDLQRLLDELNRKQRENVNKGWIVVIMPKNQASKRASKHANHLEHNNINNAVNNNNNKRHENKAHTYVRRRTLMETIKHEREERVSHHQGGGDDDDHGHGGELLHKFLKPWTKLFSWTLPSPEGSFVTKHIYLSIIAIIMWLGLLTFFVVDCSEKIGECFHIPGNLLGITLLAVGSSLPDCISSIIVARQMKIDMAVANAFGSNIFDVNLCVGFSFILGSIAKAIQGEPTSIYLGDGYALQTFSELIIAAAGFMVFLWLMIWCTVFRLEKWMGYVLSVGYVGYICVFTVLFVHADDEGADFGES